MYRKMDLAEFERSGGFKVGDLFETTANEELYVVVQVEGEKILVEQLSTYVTSEGQACHLATRVDWPQFWRSDLDRDGLTFASGDEIRMIVPGYGRTARRWQIGAITPQNLATVREIIERGHRYDPIESQVYVSRMRYMVCEHAPASRAAGPVPSAAQYRAYETNLLTRIQAGAHRLVASQLAADHPEVIEVRRAFDAALAVLARELNVELLPWKSCPPPLVADIPMGMMEFFVRETFRDAEVRLVPYFGRAVEALTQLYGLAHNPPDEAKRAGGMLDKRLATDLMIDE